MKHIPVPKHSLTCWSLFFSLSLDYTSIIYENDRIGQAIADILIRKAKSGVTVRFIYDDFGSKGIRKNFLKRLKAAGIEAYPFYKVKFLRVANHLNYARVRLFFYKKGFVHAKTNRQPSTVNGHCLYNPPNIEKNNQQRS